MAAVFMASCDQNENPLVIVEVENISLNRDSITLSLNEEFVLIAVVTPNNALVEWSSSNPNIAKVNEGVVTALSLGKTTIIAKAGNKVATCVVSVASSPSVEEGVFINGLRWATRNVGTFGTFVDNPADVGMFYQWNKPTAWAATGVVTGWDNTMPTGTTWEVVNDPCPVGWRVPTSGELSGLVSAAIRTWTTENGMNGMLFGNGINTIFLPAAGLRNDTNGTLSDVGTTGWYWSSTESQNNLACLLNFNNVGVLSSNGINKPHGLSVRCVKE